MWETLRALDGNLFLVRTKFYVPDKPGSLAKLAELFSKRNINIVLFYYNRSEHPNRVVIEGKALDSESLKSLYEEAQNQGFFEEIYEEDLEITELENILKLSIYLEHKPGTLFKVAQILKKHEANVIYMIFNELVSENKANIAFYVKDSNQINSLLNELNALGYHYNLEYSGVNQEDTNKLIGLNLVEKFYLKLKKILSEEEVENLRKIINASKYLSETLLKFNKEAGQNLEAGQVFANILTFAISSRTKVNTNFFYKKLPSLPIGDILIHTFKLPTGGNLYLLETKDEYVMIDGSYGIYYEDVKKMLRQNGIFPEKIRRIYISHPDADHAGLSGYFEEEFNTEVYLHKDAIDVIENENRVYGVNTPLYDLNHYFTILVNYFTKCKFPQNYKVFNTEEIERYAQFKVIDFFKVGDYKFKVLESLGGHIPGQVFFLCEEAGVIFTADYLLYVPSLTEEEKNILNIPKFLMTSTNANSRIFRQEMELLKNLCIDLDKNLRKQGKGLIIFPGHGDFYPARFL